MAIPMGVKTELRYTYLRPLRRERAPEVPEAAFAGLVPGSE